MTDYQLDTLLHALQLFFSGGFIAVLFWLGVVLASGKKETR